MTKIGSSFWSILLVFLRLGFTSFGGPIAHLGYFRDEFVTRRKWLDEHSYADLVALCQFLPGPASSQVGAAIGLARGGVAGAFAAWLGFTLPSAVALILFGLSLVHLGNGSPVGAGWLHGLKIVAVAVVAQASWAMGKSLCPDRVRATIACAALAVAVAIPSTVGQVAVIVGGGFAGLAILRGAADLPHVPVGKHMSKRLGATALVLFAVLLGLLPVVAPVLGPEVQSLERFYHAGALVFGGGHVVLPLLQAEVVPTMMSNDTFLAGYGIAQAVPGPLFTFSAYLGAVSQVVPSGWLGAAIGLVGIFLPGILLIVGIMPFWERLRRLSAMQAAMRGVNAAVVGLLLAALYNPVWTSAILQPMDFAIAAAAFLALVFWKVPPWLVVLLCAGAGALMP